jgi:hypothetical protein
MKRSERNEIFLYETKGLVQRSKDACKRQPPSSCTPTSRVLCFRGAANGRDDRAPPVDRFLRWRGVWRWRALAAARSKDTAGIDRTFGCWPERRESPRTPAKRAPGRLGCVRFCRSIRGQVTRRRVRRFLLLPHASLRSGRYGRLSSLRGYVLLQHSTIFLFLFF